LDAEEYEILRRLDGRVAMPVEALSQADLDGLDVNKFAPGARPGGGEFASDCLTSWCWRTDRLGRASRLPPPFSVP
jgi:hypothetical protein